MNTPRITHGPTSRLLVAWLFAAFALVVAPHPVAAQFDPPIADLYRDITRRGSDYVTAGSAPVYKTTSARDSVGVLLEGDRVHRLRQRGDWTRIRSTRGLVGYVRSDNLSNRWIFVSKNRHMLYVYEGLDFVKKFPVDLAVNYRGDKERRGGYANPEDWKTPEGLFFISWKRTHSRFHRALVMNYPTPSHASRGLRRRTINRDTFARIVKSNQMLQSPPMNTPLGGWIEIHGHGVDGRANWTRGCIALENDDIDALWQYVGEGTPVMVGRYTRDPSRRGPQPIAHRPPAATRMKPPFNPGPESTLEIPASND